MSKNLWETLREETDESRQGQVGGVYSGRLQRRGKSNRSETPPDGHRSDSTGIVDQFPSQRSSDSVRAAPHLSRPAGLRNDKIFSRPCRCPPYTPPTCPCLLSVFWEPEDEPLFFISKAFFLKTFLLNCNPKFHTHYPG